MSTPNNIPGTPMGETVPDSFFEFKEKFQQQLQHIFQTIMSLTAPEQFDQLCQWIVQEILHAITACLPDNHEVDYS